VSVTFSRYLCGRKRDPIFAPFNPRPRAGGDFTANPDIAQVVFLRGLVDLLGRGTRKMVEDFKSQGLPEPAWKRQAGGICLTLRSRTTPGEIPKELNVRQIALLRRMKPGEQTDLSAYTKQTEGEWSERSLRGDLSKLVRLGYMVKQGQGKSTFYVRTEKPAA